MVGGPQERAIRRHSPTVRRVLYLIGFSGAADAMGVENAPADLPDFAERAIYGLDELGKHEFSHVDEHDRKAAEAALLLILEGTDRRHLSAGALGSPSEARDRIMTPRANEIRAGLVSAESMAYLDGLVRFVAHLISDAFSDAPFLQAALAQGVAESRTLLEGISDRIQADARQPQLDYAKLIHSSSDRAIADARKGVHREIPRLRGVLGDRENLAYPIVVLGEGGLGKTLLACQLTEAFAVQEPHRPLCFIACGAVPPSSDITTSERLGLALGSAAIEGRAEVSVVDLVTSLGPGGRPWVVIDTLDLLVSEDSASAVVSILRDLTRVCDLVVTCREREWDGWLHHLDDEVAWKVRLPQLARHEIPIWAAELLAPARDPDDPHAAHFLASLERTIQTTKGHILFGNPLRLSMACRIYGSVGIIPDDLTVTQLYEEYWASRIERDRRLGPGSAALAQTGFARSLAAEIWLKSESHFAERVALPNLDSLVGREALLSDGVVVETLGPRYGYFHQTFSEFAVALWIAGGNREADVARLSRGLQQGVSGYWGVISHLLQLGALESEAKQVFLECVPVDRPEGLRLHVRAWANSGAEVLPPRIEGVGPDLLALVSDELTMVQTPQVEVALELIVVLVGQSSQNLTRLLTSLSELIRRTSPEIAASTVVKVSESLLSRTGELGHDRVSTEIRTLIAATLVSEPSRYAWPTILQAYAGMSVPGRAGILQAAAGLKAGATDTLILRTITRFPLPDGTQDNALRVMRRCLAQPQARIDLGWENAIAIGNKGYAGGWGRCQSVIMGEFAALTREVSQVLAVAILGGSSPEHVVFVGAAAWLAAHRPDEAVASLRDMEVIPSRMAAGVLAEMCRNFTGGTRAQRLFMLEQLQLLEAEDPRAVWPAAIELASDDAALLSGVIDRLSSQIEQDLINPPARKAALDGIFNGLTLPALFDMWPQIEPLLTESTPQQATQKAKFYGRLAVMDTKARLWVRAALISGASSNQATAAAVQIEQTLELEPDCAADGLIKWLVGLVSTSHGHAAATIARCLRGAPDLQVGWQPAWTVSVVLRLERSLKESEDPQVAEGMLLLLAELAKAPGTVADGVKVETPGVIEGVFVAVRSGLGEDRRPARTPLAARYQLLTLALGSLGLRFLSEQEFGQVLLDLMISVDSQMVSNNARKALSSVLVKALNRWPSLVDSLEGGWTQYGADNKFALLEALIGESSGSGLERAHLLARRPDCPEVASDMVLRRTGK